MTDCAFTAPHAKASAIGLDILKQGGTAIEAMVAAAAAISVVYPHMTGLGGDGFWLIHEPGQPPLAINAAGFSARNSSIADYREQGLSAIPSRGAKAALNSAGAVAGWQKALQLSARWQQPLQLSALLTPAANLARDGITVTESLQKASELTLPVLGELPEFSQLFLPQGRALQAGESFYNPAFAQLLERLAQVGLDDFYSGQSGETIAAHLAKIGSPLTVTDLKNYQAQWQKPLSVRTSKGEFYNLGLPTQGLASLLIAAIIDQQFADASFATMSESAQLHQIIEATKQAFMVRDAIVGDPAFNHRPPEAYLTREVVSQLHAKINPERALEWPQVAEPGDTVWMGCCDNQGRMVSYIQSLYWEFGSGVVIPELGVVWNNRGVSFSLDEQSRNPLRPNSQPFHTLNPALALLDDGRSMVYGTMGGEGQPQTQAAILWRYLYQQQPLSESIAAPRWLLGRTWGENVHDLKLEANLPQECVSELKQLGHQLKTVPECNELMGHAGAIVAQQQQIIAAASDPRSDGQAYILRDPEIRNNHV